MTVKFLLKLNLLFGIALILITGVNLMLLFENEFSKVEIPDTISRQSALLRIENTEDRPNLVAYGLKISSEAEDNSYYVGTPIEVTCNIQNSSKFDTHESRGLVRTQYGDIASKSAALKPDEEMSFSGTFTPEKTGMMYIACRADIDEDVKESDERDNRESAALYVR